MNKSSVISTTNGANNLNRQVHLTKLSTSNLITLGEGDVKKHVDYIHYNPTKNGHVSRVADWAYSSLHRFVRLGVYPLDWGGDQDDAGTRFGE